MDSIISSCLHSPLIEWLSMVLVQFQTLRIPILITSYNLSLVFYYTHAIYLFVVQLILLRIAIFVRWINPVDIILNIIISIHKLHCIYCTLIYKIPHIFCQITDLAIILSIADDHTRFTQLYPLGQKSKALSTFITFTKMVENQFKSNVKQIQIDGGGEFTINPFISFLCNHWISHQISCQHTTQQNGVLERKHRQIVSISLCLLAQSHIQFKVQVEAFFTALFVINWLPTPLLSFKSPFEQLFSRVTV